jgi:hypothetical protein
MVRLILLPLRFLLFPYRFAAGSARAGYYAGRAVGFSRSVFFALGFASGVLVASPKARKAAFSGVGRITMAVAKAQRKDDAPPAASEPVVAPDLVVAAPHGVVLTDPVPGDPGDPTGPVLATD